METSDEPEDGACAEEKENSGLSSLSSSLGSSLSSSQDFRRQMKPPNKKKYEEDMDELNKLIKAKETEMKGLNVPSSEAVGAQMRDIRAEREATIGKRKKIDAELRELNQEITKKVGLLSRTESNLQYKNEAKIDDAIRNMEWQLKTQNFRLSEERKIVAEVDKLKRSKKILVEYFTQKKEVDKMRESQRRMRAERDYYYKTVTNLSKREDQKRKQVSEKKLQAEEIKKELDQLYEKKRQIYAEFKQCETEFHRMVQEHRNKKRKESFKKREEDRKAKDEAYRKELLEFQAHAEPFEDEKNLCNTLISYLQRFVTTDREDSILPSPREERPETSIGSAPGPADSLDDGKFVLLKKSEEAEPDYLIANIKRPARRSKKGRKLSVTKPLAHTPQIISQFSSLNLNAPSNTSEVPASVEQLQARKKYYEEQAATVSRPMLGSISGSFSSSGSNSSTDSPMWERGSTWGFVGVPPSIAENQAPSDAGTSAESGFHDMSRQASKTESSESTADCLPCDQAIDEMIQQSADYDDSENSRSSSDTITPEDSPSSEVNKDRSCSDTGSDRLSDLSKTSQGNRESVSDDHSVRSHDNDSHDSLVFEEGGGTKSTFLSEESLRTSYSVRSTYEKDMSLKIANYDKDFPPALTSPMSSSAKSVVDNVHIDSAESCYKVTEKSWDESSKGMGASICDSEGNQKAFPIPGPSAVSPGKRTESIPQTQWSTWPEGSDINENQKTTSVVKKTNPDFMVDVGHICDEDMVTHM